MGGVFAKDTSLETKFPSPFGSGNFLSLDWYFSQIPLPNMIQLPKEKGQTMIYHTLHRKLKIEIIFLWFCPLMAIVMSFLRFTAFDYPFGIFKLFFLNNYKSCFSYVVLPGNMTIATYLYQYNWFKSSLVSLII